MKVFAWLRQWTRDRVRVGEDSAGMASSEDHSSMADFVRILTRIDRTDDSRTQR
ncbi:MAG: hypothetical protein WBA29_03745 [Xanthobacteraceae bacterium]